MTEEKRVLPQETLEQVTGGNEEKTCPEGKDSPNNSCYNLRCPYRSGNHCNLYNKSVPGRTIVY